MHQSAHHVQLAYGRARLWQGMSHDSSLSAAREAARMFNLAPAQPRLRAAGRSHSHEVRSPADSMEFKKSSGGHVAAVARWETTMEEQEEDQSNGGVNMSGLLFTDAAHLALEEIERSRNALAIDTSRRLSVDAPRASS